MRPSSGRQAADNKPVRTRLIKLLLPVAILGIGVVGARQRATDIAAASDQPTTTVATRQIGTTTSLAISTTTSGTVTEAMIESEVATVVSITDGDTFRVVRADGSNEPVRLIGIDSPEAGAPFADEATALLSGLIANRQVRLVADVSDRDRFERLLRYVYIDDLFVNEEIVLAGLAEARRYPPDIALAERLESAAALAQSQGRGIWQAQQPSAAPAEILTM
jgi:endonuclease YncB( thermonuclease family)